jgi:hypothetical protein
MVPKQHRTGEPKRRPTAAQRRAQADMRKIAAAWNNLTEDQRLTWEEADRKNRRGSRASRRRRRSGRRLFTKVSFRRLALGQDLLTVAPGSDSYAPTPIMGFRIDNDGRRISLQLSVFRGEPQGVMVSSWRPVNAGVMKWKDFVHLGLLPAPVGGISDITALYVAKYGVPPVGKKVFIRIKQMNDYLGSIVQRMCAVVPPSPSDRAHRKTQ